MKRITQVALDTEHGLRTIELYYGDLTDTEVPIDLLCISSFPGDYAPMPGTVVEALSTKLGLSVAELRRTCELDLTRQFGIWISSELNNAVYRRLICVETGYESQPEEVIEKISVGVAILEALNVNLRSVAMPLLFSGSMGMPPKRIAATLVPVAERMLTRSSRLERALFIEKNEGRARALESAIDTLLGRVHVTLPQKSLVRGLKTDILAKLAESQKLVPGGHLRLVEETRAALNQKELRAVDLGILARRMVEFVVNDLLGELRTSPDIFSRIEKLGGKGIASWIQSYMHVLRVLGNEAAHEKNTDGKRPPSVEDADLTICLLCMQRIWSFWAEWRKTEDVGTS